MKVEITDNPHKGFIDLYMMKLAHLFFPKNFIKVVGCLTTPDGTDYRHELYSQMAAVPKGHALFANHGNKDGHPPCRCRHCLNHTSFHQNKGLRDRAEAFSEKAFEAGIIIPAGDQTDYCLQGQGKYKNLVFFEVDNILMGLAEAFIDSLAAKDQAMARTYLNRLRKARSRWRELEERKSETALISFSNKTPGGA